MKPGFYRLSNDDYHSGPGISRSGLVRILRSPAHFLTPVEPTDTMVFGSAFHSYTLEPKEFETQYIVRPEGIDGRTKAGKEWLASIDPALRVLKQDDYDKIRFMRDSVFRHPLAAELLSHGEAELSAYWNDFDDPDTLCKARFDWLNKPQRILVDLKKTTDARPHRFQSIAYDKGYHMEAFWYCYAATILTGIEHQDFYFVACEDSPPWGVMVYKAGAEFMNQGGIDCSRALEIYKRCMRENSWPCYSQEAQGLNLPGWAKRKEDISVIIE